MEFRATHHQQAVPNGPKFSVLHTLAGQEWLRVQFCPDTRKPTGPHTHSTPTKAGHTPCPRCNKTDTGAWTVLTAGHKVRIIWELEVL